MRLLGAPALLEICDRWRCDGWTTFRKCLVGAAQAFQLAKFTPALDKGVLIGAAMLRDVTASGRSDYQDASPT